MKDIYKLLIKGLKIEQIAEQTGFTVRQILNRIEIYERVTGRELHFYIYRYCKCKVPYGIHGNNITLNHLSELFNVKRNSLKDRNLHFMKNANLILSKAQKHRNKTLRIFRVVNLKKAGVSILDIAYMYDMKVKTVESIIHNAKRDGYYNAGVTE